MKAALDCNALVTWSSSKDDDDAARLEQLFAKSAVVVPMPAFAEFLVGVRDDEETAWLDSLTRKPRFKIAPFDRRSAHECALVHQRLRSMTPGGGKKGGRADAWQKVKFDRQILAIALTEGCDLLVCSDGALKAEAAKLGLHAITVSELPLPESAKQHKLDLQHAPSVQAIPPG